MRKTVIVLVAETSPETTAGVSDPSSVLNPCGPILLMRTLVVYGYLFGSVVVLHVYHYCILWMSLSLEMMGMKVPGDFLGLIYSCIENILSPSQWVHQS